MTAPMLNPLRAEAGVPVLAGPGRLVIRLRVEQGPPVDPGRSGVPRKPEAGLEPAPRRARFSWPWFWGSAVLGAALAAATPLPAMPGFSALAPVGHSSLDARPALEEPLVTNATVPVQASASRQVPAGIRPVEGDARRSPSLPASYSPVAGSSAVDRRAAPATIGKTPGAWATLPGLQPAGEVGSSPLGTAAATAPAARVGTLPDSAHAGVEVTSHPPHPAAPALVGEPGPGAQSSGETETIVVAKGQGVGPSDPQRLPQPSAASVRLVTVVDATTIVVTDPITRLPRPVEVGGTLHDGSRLLAVDVHARTARTDRATLRLE